MPLTRRDFLRLGAGGAAATLIGSSAPYAAALTPFRSAIYSVEGIPDNPYLDIGNPNYHAGVEGLLDLMGRNGLKFYKSSRSGPLSGVWGLIEANDVVLIKVNAQWKYRGATNSDVVRGLVQRILNHPDGFRGEVVIFENGQGRGSLACDQKGSSYSDNSVRANALDERHSFLYLVDRVFQDPRVSAFLLDSVRGRIIGASDHATNGYRTLENVSYPCFTTNGGNRVELREGVWNGSGYGRNLKLINVPVLKTHGGSEFTASIKHFYGILSMDDGLGSSRHYDGLGDACGKMVVSVRPPVLNIVDAVWVSPSQLAGYPESAVKANQLAASQDPVALDFWVAKNILFTISRKAAHSPDHPNIIRWMDSSRDVINARGGLFKPWNGLFLWNVTKDENRMLVYRGAALGLG